MATMEDAMEAFAGESQANRKYAIFADQAVAEGYPHIARLFRAASEAEAVHAKKLMKAMGTIETTEKNLEGAVAGETHEFKKMYPDFLKDAEAEKKSDMALVFTYAMKAEEIHAGHYKDALKALKAGQDMSNRTVYLCPACGAIFLEPAPEKCPVCSAVRKIFRVIE